MFLNISGLIYLHQIFFFFNFPSSKFSAFGSSDPINLGRTR